MQKFWDNYPSLPVISCYPGGLRFCFQFADFCQRKRKMVGATKNWSTLQHTWICIMLTMVFLLIVKAQEMVKFCKQHTYQHHQTVNPRGFTLVKEARWCFIFNQMMQLCMDVPTKIAAHTLTIQILWFVTLHSNLESTILQIASKKDF